MFDPVEAAQSAVLDALTPHISPELISRAVVRFRPDGKGGALATPLPLAAGLDAQALAQRIALPPLLERVFVSGGWLAFEVSGLWRQQVRHLEPGFAPLDVKIPPVPDFPARIFAADWRLDALAGITDPGVAARLDRGNPARRVRLAQDKMVQAETDGENPRLVNEAALLYHLLWAKDAGGAAKQLIALADCWLKTGGEGALVSRALALGLEALGI